MSQYPLQHSPSETPVLGLTHVTHVGTQVPEEVTPMTGCGGPRRICCRPRLSMPLTSATLPGVRKTHCFCTVKSGASM